MFQKIRLLLSILFIFANTEYSMAADSTQLQNRYDRLIKAYQIDSTKNEITKALLVLDSKKEHLDEVGNNLNHSIYLFQSLLTILGIGIAFIGIFSFQYIRQKFKIAIKEIKMKNTELDSELEKIYALKDEITKKSNETLKQLELSNIAIQDTQKVYKEELSNIQQFREKLETDIRTVVTERMNQFDVQNKSATLSQDVAAIIKEDINNTTEDTIREFYMAKYLKTINHEFEQQNWPTTLTAINSYLKYDIDSHEVYYKYGYSLYKTEEYLRAKDQFKHALTLKENFCEALWGLLYCYEKLGASQEIKEDVKRKLDDLHCTNDPFK